jgi:hypothetical protein
MSLANAESRIIARGSRFSLKPLLHWLAGSVRGFSGLSSWLISAGVHFGLALVFAGIVAQTQIAERGLFIDSSFTDPGTGTVQPLESVEFQPLTAVDSGSSSAQSPTTDATVAAAAAIDIEPVPMAAIGTGLPVGIGMDDAEGKGDGEGEGDGNGNGAGEQRGIGFFGTYTTGKSVVYVVDMSGSMGGRRFSRAKQELVKSLYRLEPEHRYSIVLFNTGAYPLYWPESTEQLLEPSKINVRRSARWVSGMDPHSFTDPSLALAWGLSRESDVLFFLTDGEIPPATRDLIRELNRKHTIVNTIAFESQAGELLLRAIAEDHGGTYRYVK